MAAQTSARDRKLLARHARTMLRVMRKIEALHLSEAHIDELEMAVSTQLQGTVARLRLRLKQREKP